MAKCFCGCDNEADRVVTGDDFPDLVGAHYRVACLDEALAGKGSLSFVERLRIGKAQQQPIGVTSGGELVYGAGRGRVTLDGGRTYKRDRGVPYLTLEDLNTAPLHSDLYDRVIAECEAAISAAILPQSLRFVADEKHDIIKTGVLKGRLEGYYPDTFEITIGFTPPTINCLRCTSPATRDGYCAYCLTSSGYAGPAEQDAVMAKCSGNGGPTGRHTERALALEKPRSTPTSRELAKAHPSTWPSQDGEP